MALLILISKYFINNVLQKVFSIEKENKLFDPHHFCKTVTDWDIWEIKKCDFFFLAA